MSLDVQLSYYLVLDYQISSEEYPSELGYWLQLGSMPTCSGVL